MKPTLLSDFLFQMNTSPSSSKAAIRFPFGLPATDITWPSDLSCKVMDVPPVREKTWIKPFRKPTTTSFELGSIAMDLASVFLEAITSYALLLNGCFHQNAFPSASQENSSSSGVKRNFQIGWECPVSTIFFD